MSVNKVLLVGRLGNTPDGRYTPSGLSVCTFSLATNEVWMNAQKEKQDHTEWHNIVTWNKTADFVSDNLDKGDLVYIEGKIRTRKYTTKDNIERRTTEIVATNLVALSSKKKASNNEPAYSNQNNINSNIESNKIKDAPENPQQDIETTVDSDGENDDTDKSIQNNETIEQPTKEENNNPLDDAENNKKDEESLPF